MKDNISTVDKLKICSSQLSYIYQTIHRKNMFQFA